MKDPHGHIPRVFQSAKLLPIFNIQSAHAYGPSYETAASSLIETDIL